MASHLIRGDETLRRAQEKVLIIVGPLMALDDIRKSKNEKKLQLKQVVQQVEKSVGAFETSYCWVIVLTAFKD